jgi:hypothetical protein
MQRASARELELDLRLAARACSNLASLRDRIDEIAEHCERYHPAATTRDLAGALTEAAEGGT